MYRVYLYLVIDSVKVARVEVPTHWNWLQLIQCGILENFTIQPNTYIGIQTEAEIAEPVLAS